ncbi:alpha/beta fold hydrolase [Trichloromonas sp.]|uniref:alpha/beta fold hydrolase n=1 Tax=Trichloromonas sp. TaxID=3069249 RepID=UPI003D81A88B
MKSFTLPDGRRLTWREAGAGRPLLLLHGWAMSSAVFAEAMESLAEDFRVLAPDLRGHGGSDAGDGYGFADFAADLRLWLQSLGIGRFSLLGWSMGGQVAIELCQSAAGPVDRLILVGSTPRFAAGDGWEHGLPDVQVRTMARNLNRNYLKTMGSFFELMFAGETLTGERYRQVIDRVVRAGRLPEPQVALAALDTLRTIDQRPLLAGIACPTLVMHGDLDQVTLPAAGRCLAETIPGARLALLPGLAHAPFLSRPQQVFRLWREFLA